MAYTKYSLTPADNNAAPPNGAPEGMLPSAVNDTMRDMMAQIRDVGDGIRGGTYTMTAPVITGGSITGVALSGNTLTNPVITGGSINNTTVGATTRSTGAFTTLASNGATTFTAGTASTSTTTGTAVITGGLGVSGRINAANFDGIIGANTAAAGNFTTLGATGVATFSAGTVSAPAITTTGDTNTGIFFPAADTIAFTEGGVESMRIDASGNLGIGTSSPAQKLDVNGTANFGNINTGNGVSTGSATIELGGLRTGDGTSIIDFHSVSGTDYETRIIRVGGANGALQILNAGTGDFRIQASGAAPMIFDTTALERMRIDSSGNVGIGTSSPNVKLDVNGISGWGGSTTGIVSSLTGANASHGNGGNLRVLTSTTQAADVGGSMTFGGYYIGTSNSIDLAEIAGRKENSTSGNTAGYLQFGTRANAGNITERMRIDSSGNVGIGTSSPAAKLHVSGNLAVENSGGFASLEMGGASGAFIDMKTPFSDDYDFRIQLTSSLAILNTVSAIPITFGTNDAERMRVNSTGEFLIQCTGIDVDRPNVAGGTLKQTNGNTKVRVTGDGTAAFQFYSPTGGTSTVGAISANAASTTYATTSDYRLKESVAPMTGALAKIALLKPVTYKWKSNGANGQGFIAHELQEVAPDCVTGEKDAVREDGVPIYQGIDTSFLVATLTAAIQEQQALIENLTTRLNALEGK